MKKFLILAMLLLPVVAGSKDKAIITVKGSDTMVILAQRWAEVYMTSHPDITVQVTGGGSGVGISALINGTTDIANASRPMKPGEREKLKQRYNSLGVEVKTARDGLSVYLHSDNPVTSLTLDQIKAIYTGLITNWKDVGGNDAKIILYGRENSSGTYVYFKDNVLQSADFAPALQSLPGTAAVVNAVAKDPNGIGFGGAAYAKGIKYCAVAAKTGAPAYEPTEENIKKGLYPISRFLYMYLRSKPTGALKEYIDWILSPDGQKLVAETGYFPIR
ncbi:MAG: phosphate ABC transporter substrate-binding protein [Calditrichaeota bacterium]|nr:phosphate ABC transporter substrate-binding protein [Calditrichota bacterium]